MTWSAVQAMNSVSVHLQLDTDHPHQPETFSRPNQTLLPVSIIHATIAQAIVYLSIVIVKY